MDKTVEVLEDYANSTSFSDINDDEKEAIKMRIADSFITAFTAISSPPTKILLNTIGDVRGQMDSTIYFSKRKVFTPYAVMLNGCMTRYMDYNDTYLSKEALHPSDNIPPLITMAETKELEGKDVIRAVKVAYDIVCSFADAVSIRDRGWDHVNYDSISSSAALASMLELNGEKFENAVSLSIINNISMRQTRAGKLSMWKGCTVAYETMSSTLAVLNASAGLTGPSDIFEGEMGFKKQVSGEFQLEIKPHVMKTMIKNYPVEYHAMSAAQAAANLKDKLDGNIKKIDVETFKVAHTIIIKDPEKLRPQNKETADHSMPYIIAYTLNYGEPDVHSYDDKYLNDKKILDTIDKIHFKVTERFDKMYPEYLPVKISVTDQTSVKEEEIDVPKGHFRDPYTWKDLEAKARRVNPNLVELVSYVRNIENKSLVELKEVMTNVAAEGQH
ncbi:MMGE/PRPD family protein [Thermoplasma volcanium GSS1]|uniref:MMGE/PRPD family protein n=1 Tax=Thermoplasma volcanium (strain ATCC 51530 / DSM 4299 / JCM 9571 / NBRC 15438 / GSS1) TaxID=273116 RepID=Q97BT2_THEVO|nr:MmgE/PrpD family protein [Thermoplasma volcanium]BAB59515.1 MMGE/PRPD family protein [Thermoplasma volcanium GSS1]